MKCNVYKGENECIRYKDLNFIKIIDVTIYSKHTSYEIEIGILFTNDIVNTQINRHEIKPKQIAQKF